MFHAVFLLLTAPASEPVELAQLSIEQRVIIRVPMAPPPRAAVPSPPPLRWEEKKGPRCIAIRSIRAAAVDARRGIDIILHNNHRYRARLERSCPPAGFYSGFYIEPPADKSLCAGRDIVRSRSGMICEITSFKELVAED